MQRVLVQARKEWCSFRRDRLGMALAVVLPLGTLLLFGYGVRLQNRNIPVVVKDADSSKISKKLVAELETSKFVDVMPEGRENSIEEMRTGAARAVVEIPRGFGESAGKGVPSAFQTLIDGSDVSTAETLRALVAGASARIGMEVSPPDMQARYLIPDIDMFFNPGAREAPFIVSGVFAVVLWMYPALLAAVAVSRELEQETIVQVYASSLSGPEFLLGKGAVYFCVGMLVAVLMMVLSSFLFGLELAGDPLPLLAATVIYVLGAVSFGLLAGVATREENVAVQATATGGFFPALLLSGFVYPLANIPFPLSLVCYVVPARYYIEVCRDAFLRGMGWSEMWWRMPVLAAFALILFAGAWSGIRRMQMED